ncbi:hypothetical protein HispidOSU_002224, partial [Sigmodon hispidus]
NHDQQAPRSFHRGKATMPSSFLLSDSVLGKHSIKEKSLGKTKQIKQQMRQNEGVWPKSCG